MPSSRVSNVCVFQHMIAANLVVAGEKLVTPSSIVSLTFQARYVYPTTSTTGPTANGKVEGTSEAVEPNGDGKAEGEMQQATSEIEKTAEDAKEKVVEVVEKTKSVGRKGKQGDKEEKTWASNGFAYAPRWPQVSCETCIDHQLMSRSENRISRSCLVTRNWTR